MAKGRHITQKDLNQIKIMREASLNVKQIAKILHRGESTIHRAEQANYVYDDYRELTLLVNRKYRKEEGETNGQVKKEKVNSTILVELKNINSNLEKLVLAWSEKPNKRKWL